MSLKIAIQKEGRLKEASLKFLAQRGLKFAKENGRSLVTSCLNADLDILYVRHSDIPQYVENLIVDFGIVGGNVLYEKGFKGKILGKLSFGQCSLAIAIPEDSPIKSITDLEGERLATSYPKSLSQFLQNNKIKACIVEISGAVEVAPKLGIADAICDLVQTGETLRNNNLKVLTEIFSSEAMLVESPIYKLEKKQFLTEFFKFENLKNEKILL